jgi:hypothetical protein
MRSPAGQNLVRIGLVTDIHTVIRRVEEVVQRDGSSTTQAGAEMSAGGATASMVS